MENPASITNRIAKKRRKHKKIVEIYADTKAERESRA